MKKFFLTISITLISFLFLVILILSTIGYETDKFNKLISEKISENNKNISLTLEKIKFKFDINDLKLFLETKNSEINYYNVKVPIEKVKTYLNFLSLVSSKPKIDKIDLSLKEIDVDKLKKIIIKTKPSSLNSLIVNRIIKGKMQMNLELFFQENFKLENFILKGSVSKMSVNFKDKLEFKDTSFNFFADSSDIIIKNIKGSTVGVYIKNGSLQFIKGKDIKINSEFTSEINLAGVDIKRYLPMLKNLNFINQDTKLIANIDNFIKISFDKTFKVIDYEYNNKGKAKELSFKFEKPIKNLFLKDNINDLFLKDTIFDIYFNSDKKNELNTSGTYSLDNKNFQKFNLKNNFINKDLKLDLSFDTQHEINLDLINFKKEKDKVANINIDLKKQKNFLKIKKFNYVENKNIISIENLEIDKGKFSSLKKIKVKTYHKDKIKNDFIFEFGKKIIISGNKYDANNLNKYLNTKTNNNYLKNINKEIDIDLKYIDTPMSKKLTNFKLIGVIAKGKFIKILSKGDFGNNEYLDISMKSDEKTKKKYLEIYSDLPQPLLSEYSFFKGLSGGTLNFSSIIEKDSSTSKLIIDNFKVINAPGVVKLLSLADFGGLADLAEGEGLSFDKMEINLANEKGFLRLNELYAVGPSISVLMEGYKDQKGLTSLKGTLVPAKNLNKLLSKIPVIGKIIIPDEIGEGLFGVSFKMKGLPGKIKTSINPIKTLTPRFITKVLEKSKHPK